MKAHFFRIFFRSILPFLVFFLRNVNAAGDVDLIFVNGNVYTLNEKQPHAEAIAVRGRRIAFVGSNEDARKFRGHKTRIIDLSGKTVAPGFTDSHCHIFGIGEREMRLNLEGTNSLEGFLARLSAANGSPGAAGSKLSGNRLSSRREKISTKSCRTIQFFSRAPMVMPRSPIAPR